MTLKLLWGEKQYANRHMSNEKIPGCLGYVCDNILPSYYAELFKPLQGDRSVWGKTTKLQNPEKLNQSGEMRCNLRRDRKQDPFLPFYARFFS